jgi:LDH2 family malate/lactate/ureidoglycolate dehydrogenase
MTDDGGMMIAVERARRLCRAVFVDNLKAPSPIANVATEVLVEANLRGIDSHGIGVLPYYLEKAAAGQIVSDAEPVLVGKSPATAVFDARQSIGHYSSALAMDAAIERANDLGLGAAVVRQSTHNGAISHYTIQAARAGMMGIAATACAPHVAPHGGTAGLHGTNPISYAFPRQAGDPVVFDLSTGHSSAKLKNAEQDGQVPLGRLLAADGSPTTDVAALKGGWILPVAGHVGFGLALLVDGLTACLADSPVGRQIPLVHESSGPYHGSFFAMAIAPGAFGGSIEFEARIADLVSQIESHTPQDPGNPVRWPGQRGWQVRRQRIAEGIPIKQSQWRQLVDELAAFGVTVP